MRLIIIDPLGGEECARKNAEEKCRTSVNYDFINSTRGGLFYTIERKMVSLFVI